MTQSTVVRSAAGKSVLLEIAPHDDRKFFECLGFRLFLAGDNVYRYRGNDESDMHRMVERLRDLEIPFSSQGHCGADEQVSWMRANGCIKGKFRRIRTVANDWEGGRFYIVEDF